MRKRLLESPPMRPRIGFAFLAMLVALIGIVPAFADRSADSDYEAIAEEYIKGFLVARPLLAVRLGFHEYDGKVPDFSPLALDAELARLRRFDDRLSKFDPSKLSQRQSLDLRILQAAIKRELFQRVDMASFERDPMAYIRAVDVNVYISRNFAPLDDRVHSIAQVEWQIPNIIIAAKGNLDPVLPKPLVELAIQVAKGAADYLRGDMIEAAKDVKDDRIKGEFADANRKAIAAFSDYAAWLERDRLPTAKAEFAIGEEKYRRMLADGELVDMAPAQVLDLGLAKLKEEQEAFATAAKIIDPEKSPIEVFKQIQNEHPTPDTLIPAVAKDLEDIRKYITARKLVTIPSEVRAKVKETPPYRRATSFASMDTPGPFEKRANEAYYYVTPPEDDWPDQQKQQWLTSFNTYTSDIVSIHEAYPGHYVQFLRLNASGASKVEKIFGSYAFIEGWAHYCEKMMLDEGFGAPPPQNATDEDNKRAAKYRMAQADEALLRLCRLCASIKMHTQNMSVDEATKFFQDNCYYEEKPARAEAMRGTFDPGYLNYTLGKLQILKLRADYQRQQGDGFSLQKFHNELLNHGMPPIRLLREMMLKDKAKWPEVL